MLKVPVYFASEDPVAHKFIEEYALCHADEIENLITTELTMDYVDELTPELFRETTEDPVTSVELTSELKRYYPQFLPQDDGTIVFRVTRENFKKYLTTQAEIKTQYARILERLSQEGVLYCPKLNRSTVSFIKKHLSDEDLEWIGRYSDEVVPNVSDASICLINSTNDCVEIDRIADSLAEYFYYAFAGNPTKVFVDLIIYPKIYTTVYY